MRWVLLLLVATFALSACSSEAPEESVYKPLSTGTTENGDVRITLTPTITGNAVSVDISANTHSVDLSEYDLKESMKLETEEGTVAPSSASQLGGHHSSGTALFEVASRPETLKIYIEGVPQEAERAYEWPLTEVTQ